MSPAPSLIPLPQTVATVAELDELLSRPSPALVALMGRLTGDIAILGIAGKMGVSLGHLAVRASRAAGTARRILGVARFSEAGTRAQLDALGVETIACDLLDPHAVARLPRVPNVLYLAGRKFGTQDNQALTWAVNTLAPAHVARHYAGSRIVAFSTGCVYPLVSVARGGCDETVPPAPIGEYAQSALARERLFEYFCATDRTPVCLYRLNYAVDLRYGVLHDLASRIWQGQPVDTTVGHFNVIWQGDANEIALRALEHARVPAAVLNVTGIETVAVRSAAETLAALMGRPVTFSGSDGGAAYLNNASRARELFGPPRVSLARMLEWTARWVMAGGASLHKPTHFEVSTGTF